jgi:phage terminase large subunit-like protein
MAEGGEAVEFTQNAANMGPAADEFITAIHDYRVHHDGNPITTWCVSNLVAKRHTGKLPVPTKQKPHNKIDGAIAAIMACGRAAAGSEPGGPVIDTDYQLMVI